MIILKKESSYATNIMKHEKYQDSNNLTTK